MINHKQVVHARHQVNQVNTTLDFGRFLAVPNLESKISLWLRQPQIVQLHTMGWQCQGCPAPRNPKCLDGSVRGPRPQLLCIAWRSQQATSTRQSPADAVDLEPANADSRPRRRRGPLPQRPSPDSPLQPSTLQQSNLLQPHELTACITSCTSCEQLQQLCTEHRGRLNYIHASAALNRLAKLLDSGRSGRAGNGAWRHGGGSGAPGSSQDAVHATSQCIHTISTLALAHTPEFQPRALANALWACSKLMQAMTHQPPPSNTPLGDELHHAATALHTLTTSLLRMLPELSPGFEPQHFSNSIYALGLIHTCTQEGSSFFASVQGATATTLDSSSQQQAEARGGELGAGQLRAAAAQLLKASTPHVTHMTSQGISNMLYGSAQLGLQPDDPWMNAALDTLLDKATLDRREQPLDMPVGKAALDRRAQPFNAPVGRRDQVESQHVANTLWALARLGYYPGDDWLEALLLHITTQPALLARLTPQGLANTLWACATLQAQPAPHVLDPLLAAVMRHAPAFSAQDVSNVMWALAELWRLVQPTSPTVHVTEQEVGLQQQSGGDDEELDAAVQVGGGERRQQQRRMQEAALRVLQCSVQPRGGGTDGHVARQDPVVAGPPVPAATTAPGTSSNGAYGPSFSSRGGGGAVSTGSGSPSRTSGVDSEGGWGADRAGWSNGGRVGAGREGSGASVTDGGGGGGAGGEGSRASEVTSGAQSATLWDATPQHLANILWAASSLQLHPPAGWYAHFWSASYPQLPHMGRQEVGMVMLALGRLRALPPQTWWERVQRVSLLQLPEATPRYLAHCVWAMARLDSMPPRLWLNAFMRQVHRHGPRLGPKASTCITSSLLRLGLDAPNLEKQD